MLIVVISVGIWARRRKQKASMEMKIIGSITGIKIDKEIGGIHRLWYFLLHLVGQFGKVYLGIWNETTSVALKCIKGEAFQRNSGLQSEITLLSRLQHPNIIQYLGLFVDDAEVPYIVTEYMDEGSLLDYLRRNTKSVVFGKLNSM